MNTRRIAYRVLRRFEKDKRLPIDEINISMSGMKEKDRAFFKELVWGTLRRQIYLDYVIDTYLKNPQIPPAVRVALRLGVYQLLFMDSVPDYAAVSESVKLLENKSFRKLVNALLRKVAKRDLKEPDKIHIKYSHPKWIAEYLMENYGYKIAERIMENHLLPAPVVLRSNSLKFQRDDLLIMMKDEGFSAKATKHSPQGIKIHYNNEPLKHPFVQRGLATYQGESSQLASLILSPQKGWKVLDMAAGYGGKTTHMAELMENSGKIIAIDTSIEKIENLNERAKKLGIDIIETAVMDARNAPAVFSKDFDAVLLDAPCSSLGTARKNPDVLLSFRKTNINNLVVLQKELIDAAFRILKKGGFLLYATCTFIREENEGVVKYLLESHDDAKIVNIKDKLNLYDVEHHWDGAGALFLPDETLTEFYVSLIKKE